MGRRNGAPINRPDAEVPGQRATHRRINANNIARVHGQNSGRQRRGTVFYLTDVADEGCE